MILSSRPRFVSRRGVTLLEVLVAIGVMVVGLLGMLALIPLGRMELAEAEKLDNSATIGRWAFRDMTVRGYLQPENWVNPVTGLSVFGAAEEPVAGYSTSLVPGNKTREFSIPQAMTPPVAPIVIDPLMLAPRKFPLASDETAQRQICRLFPYSLSLSGGQSGMPEGAANRPQMARVSLRSFPADIVSSNPANMMMRAEVASRFFRSSDDLNFNVPLDTSKRPIQVFSKSSASTLQFYTNDGFVNDMQPSQNIAARSFRGAFSWFMVVEPSLAEFYSASPNNSPALGGPSASAVNIRQYRVWVIVCHQRPLNSVNGQTLAQADAVSERLVYVDFVDRNTARLRVGGLNNEGDAANALNVKANQWIAVVGRYAEPLVPGGNRYVMEWYRVTGVADRPTHLSGTQWYREVTLVGREFFGLGFSFIDEDSTTYPDMAMSLGGSSNPTQPVTGWGVIVSGVRGVYEKSVYVDRPSLYSIRY